MNDLAYAAALVSERLDLEEPWRLDALCLEYPAVNFFPERGESKVEALRICERCLVRQECRDYAFEHQIDDGVWGGLAGRKRRELRRTENREAAA